MKNDDLRRIRGIGDVLERRLRESGVSSFDDIVGGGEPLLKGIRGLNPRQIPSILEQAARLAAESNDQRHERVARVRERAQALRILVQDLVASLRGGLASELSPKKERKLSFTFSRLIDMIGKIEEFEGKRLRSVEKALDRVEKRIGSLSGDAGYGRVRRRMKKSGKTLERIFR